MCFVSVNVKENEMYVEVVVKVKAKSQSDNRSCVLFPGDVTSTNLQHHTGCEA